MSFQPNKPEASDKLRVSQADLKENFSQLDAIFDVDHVKYSDATGDAGKHVYNTFVNLTDKVIVSPTTSAEEMAVYVKDDASGDPRMFYREPSSGTEQQLTGKLTDTGTVGECALPGGLGMKWGQITMTPGIVYATEAFTYAGLGLTDFTTDTYSVVLTAIDTSIILTKSPSVPAKNAAGFSVFYFQLGTINWVAIGK